MTSNTLDKKASSNPESPTLESLIAANRILPEGFSCVRLSDGKTLVVYSPNEKYVVYEKQNHTYPGDTTEKKK